MIRGSPRDEALVVFEEDACSLQEDEAPGLPLYLRGMNEAGVIDRLHALDARLMDALVAVALAVLLELQLVLADVPGASPVAVIGGLAITLPLAWRRRAPLAVAMAFAATAPLQALLGGDLYSGERPLIAALLAGGLAFYSLGAHASERQALLGIALGVLGLWAAVIAAGDPDPQSFVLSAGIVGLSPWLAGRVTRARSLRALALERERDQRALVAASEERERIARELHDVVAHGVVLMVLQAQGAGRILDQDPGRAREALATIEETGNSALSELRRSLGGLGVGQPHPELRPQPSLNDLGEMIEEMRQAGLLVELRVEGPERDVPHDIGRSAYRIVQEALTNTIKHAGLVSTRVTISYESDHLALEIADDGPGPPLQDDNGSPGRGLAGMRERVRLHGGTLHAGPRNRRGFVVRARIPVGT